MVLLEWSPAPAQPSVVMGNLCAPGEAKAAEQSATSTANLLCFLLLVVQWKGFPTFVRRSVNLYPSQSPGLLCFWEGKRGQAGRCKREKEWIKSIFSFHLQPCFRKDSGTDNVLQNKVEL